MNGVPASLSRYRADLVAAIDRELEGASRARPRRTLARPWHSRWGALLLATTLVGAAFLVLTIVAPWQSSRTILDRAEAALLAPSAGSVLYERVTVHPIIFSSRGTVARVQLWVDGARPRRFRMTFGGAWQVELGGSLGTSTGLNYVASDDAFHREAFSFRVRQSDLDPAAFIRAALESGRAKLDGRATIRGRGVIRIQLRTWFNTMVPPAHVLQPIALYYVDAHTYRPVRLVIPPPQGRVRILPDTDAANPVLDYGHYPGVLAEDSSLGFPIDPGAFLLGSPGYSSPTLLVLPAAGAEAEFPRLHRVYDFEDYRLLAPTAANRRLTNVRAMHPRAETDAS
jgi:hypothetical protein